MSSLPVAYPVSTLFDMKNKYFVRNQMDNLEYDFLQNIPFLGSLGGLHHGRMIRITGEALYRDWYALE